MEESSDFLLKIKEVANVEEALLVSTCNRTELYYACDGNKDQDDLIRLLGSAKALAPEEFTPYLQRYNAQEAIDHLFEVALGLDSQVLGDIQIANQVKRAYQQSADLELAGPVLHRLLHTIFFANKRVVQETRLQDGMASVASVAVDVITGFVENMQNPTIALVGLGEIGQNVLDNLDASLASTITLANRTKSKAEKLASAHQHCVVRDYTDLDQIVSEHDVIISAVTTESCIITSEMVPANTVRKLFIDLSVPRSIEDSLEELSGVLLFNVDQLTERTQQARKVREASIPDARNIIRECVQGFNSWKNEMEVSPTIKKLKGTLEQIRREELARHTKVSEEEMALLEVVTKNMVQKMIKLPVLQLKAACKRGEADTLVEVINDLFNLEAEKATSK